MTITARLYRDGALAEDHLDPAKVSNILKSQGGLVWLDVDRPTPEILGALQEEFGFHELAVEDSLAPHQRPKADTYEGYYFIVAYLIEAAQSGGVTKRELAAFVSERYLVTIRKDPDIDLTQVAKQWEAHPARLAEGGGYMLYVLLDSIVDGYFEAVDALEDRTEDVEQVVLGDETRDERMDIFNLRKELFQIRRAVAPLRDVLDSLQRRTLPVITPDLEPYYRDVYDHVLRVTDYIDTLRDILESIFDAHLSAVNNRLNETVKRLTSWAAIVAVPTLIASIYGMNFRHMPELGFRFGYLYALLLMGGLSFFLYRFFKRRDWL